MNDRISNHTTLDGTQTRIDCPYQILMPIAQIIETRGLVLITDVPVPVIPMRFTVIFVVGKGTVISLIALPCDNTSECICAVA